jgi:hypothetical protein
MADVRLNAKSSITPALATLLYGSNSPHGSTDDGNLTPQNLFDLLDTFISTVLTEKGAPIAGDFILGTDSADSDNLKKFDIGDLPFLTAAGVAALTNKTFDADAAGNSLTNIEDANIKTGAAIAQSKIANLVADLAAKAALVHTHTESDITDLQAYLTSVAIGDLPVGSAFQRYRTNSAGTAVEQYTEKAGFQFVIDGGGSAITTGIKGYLEIPFDCQIVAGRMLADQSGSAVVDIWKDTYANYPPTDADSITAAAPLTISSAIKSEDTTLTGWTTVCTAGDIIGFNVDSASTIQKLTVSLTANKRG